MNIELIYWRDSVHRGGWSYLEDIPIYEGRIISTIGIVVRESDIDVVIAQSMGDAGGGGVFCNICSIPKCCIASREKIMELDAKS